MEKDEWGMKGCVCRQKRSHKGFTVVELLIALMIFVIVGAMTAVIFRATQQSFVKAKAFQHVIDIARQVVMRMHNEIQATFIDASGRPCLVGIDASGTRLKADSVADELFFIAPERGETEGAVSEIGYWQRGDGNFMRHFEIPPDFNFDTSDTDNRLGLIISDLSFQYFDGADFVDAWDSRVGGEQEGLYPKAIQFSFYVSDKGNVITKKFESRVHLAATGR